MYHCATATVTAFDDLMANSVLDQNDLALSNLAYSIWRRSDSIGSEFNCTDSDSMLWR